MNEILKFYSRKDVQKMVLGVTKDREIAVRYQDSFGKRPDILQFESDILELARQGATSFHMSVEKWKNPLDLRPGLTRKQLDELRLGFDIILDIDSKFIECSKITAQLVIEALKFSNIQNINVKFSGGSGFHIQVPFESFPKEVNGIETRLLFPEAPKAIIEYLKNLIQPYLREQVLKVTNLEDISKATSIPKEKLKEKNHFNPFKLIEIDSQLISSRHMIRSYYSINEKTGLVSIPIEINKISKFNPKQAKISNIEETKVFTTESLQPEEAKQLFIQAFDFILKEPILGLTDVADKVLKKEDYEIPKTAVEEKFFPSCIQNILKGVQQDGRKRSVFILISFLQHMGWSYTIIQKRLLEWNKKNYDPLRDGYIISQINWFKRQSKKILPPNCQNENYYKSLGHYCYNCKFKNPVNFVKIQLKNKKDGKKSKSNRR